jgi:hypothetical protein
MIRSHPGLHGNPTPVRQHHRVNTKVPLGNDEVPLGNDEVPLGNDEVPLGNDEVPLGNDEVPLGNDEVPLGNDEVPLGNDDTVSCLTISEVRHPGPPGLYRQRSSRVHFQKRLDLNLILHNGWEYLGRQTVYGVNVRLIHRVE